MSMPQDRDSVSHGSNPPRLHRAAIAAILALSLAATAWLLHDPLLDGNPYLERNLEPPEVPHTQPGGRPAIWRLSRPQGGHLHLIATWRIGRQDSVIAREVNWALAAADSLALDDMEIAGDANAPLHSFAGPAGRRHLRQELAGAGLKWLDVRERTPHAARRQLLQHLSESQHLSSSYGLRQRLHDFAGYRGMRRFSIDEECPGPPAGPEQGRREAQALLTLATSHVHVPLALAMMADACNAGDLDWLHGNVWCELIDPLPPGLRAKRRQHQAEAIATLCRRPGRPLIAIDAMDLCGDDSLLAKLAEQGIHCQPLQADPFLEFPDIPHEILNSGDPQNLQSAWIANWMRRAPRDVRAPRVVERLRLYLDDRDHRAPLLAALAEALQPITRADAGLLDALGIWQIAGASAALAGLPEAARDRPARLMLDSASDQDWPAVVAALDRAPTEQLIRLALSVPSAGAYRAIRERLAAMPYDEQSQRILLQHIAAPNTPEGRRRAELIAQFCPPDGAQAIDPEATWLLHLARQPPNGFAAPIDAALWTSIGPERWRTWLREAQVDREILISVARAGCATRDPTSPLGRIAIAALEEGGKVRELVLSELRQVNYDWLFLLLFWASSDSVAERARRESLLDSIDTQWPARMAAAYAANGMFSDQHTGPMSRLVASRPAGLAALLASGTPPRHTGRAIVPKREVMMAYEFAAAAVNPALALLADADVQPAVRDNVIILLRLILQSPPDGCASDLPRIRIALERALRR